jgi:hypothetical protein
MLSPALQALGANTRDWFQTSMRVTQLFYQQVGAKISDIENVEIVFKDGVGYDSEKLIQSVQGLVGIR